MWKLLPACLLVSCAVNDKQPVNGGNPPSQFRIVRQMEMPLASPVHPGKGRPSKKMFQRTGMQAWVADTGVWHVKGEVDHGRLRCATYETGLQLGRGNPACSAVEWLTGVEYVTRLRHCNSASRLHAGGGEFRDVINRFEEVSCVRVVVRCEGAC